MPQSLPPVDVDTPFAARARTEATKTIEEMRRRGVTGEMDIYPGMVGYMEATAAHCVQELRACLPAIKNETAYQCVYRVITKLEGKAP